MKKKRIKIGPSSRMQIYQIIVKLTLCMRIFVAEVVRRINCLHNVCLPATEKNMQKSLLFFTINTKMHTSVKALKYLAI